MKFLLLREWARSKVPADAKNWKIFGGAHAFRSSNTVDAGGPDKRERYRSRREYPRAGKELACLESSHQTLDLSKTRPCRGLFPCQAAASARKSFGSKRLESSRDASVAQAEPWRGGGGRRRERSVGSPVRTAASRGQITKRYPIPASVRRCLGCDGSSSIFLRRCAMYTRT